MFKSGDVVILKSGGPIMTVDSDLGDGDFYCRWFVEGDLKSDTFKGNTLELFDE